MDPNQPARDTGSSPTPTPGTSSELQQDQVEPEEPERIPGTDPGDDLDRPQDATP
jgi:hypothetical protein